MIEQVLVPDIGGAEEVEVIEVLVAIGDTVGIDDSLVVLESDKASMEIPSPISGKIADIKVKVGDKVDEGALILELEIESAEKISEKTSIVEETKEAPLQSIKEDIENKPKKSPIENAVSSFSEKIVSVPDVGDAKDIMVTEILVKKGDILSSEDSIVVLESDKASMEIPTPFAGEVLEVLIAEGQEVNEGDEIVRLKTSDDSSSTVQAASAEASETNQESNLDKPAVLSPEPSVQKNITEEKPSPNTALVHAGPAVRKQARQYGVNLSDVKGTGKSGRILKEDIQEYVKKQLSEPVTQKNVGGGIPPIPEIDFSRFGEIELAPLSRIKKASAKNLHRSWLNVPHVTQFDEADITELEEFRKTQNVELAKQGVKLTPLAFLVKACVNALVKFPQFNASIEADYGNMILKKYYNIGIAVETPDGLVVPVLKDVDKKGIIEIGNECGELARLARDKKLPMDAMQGASFTISSLGGIGGTAFTPIVNAPEVAILGVSRSKISPQWNGSEFVPRMMLPLSLSYDHRAIDGAEAARFSHYLSQVITDVRRLLL
ncbi:MAG: pyruvate dehydrogenase E2 component (dihydrolipoamide acetyltransferase) [Candidatus Azotimanducaceae bacterium]|jgi:pyruvate dehydrogenase E2 component (dihydrolipoamide acetyltransferase)